MILLENLKFLNFLFLKLITFWDFQDYKNPSLDLKICI